VIDEARRRDRRTDALGDDLHDLHHTEAALAGLAGEPLTRT